MLISGLYDLIDLCHKLGIDVITEEDDDPWVYYSVNLQDKILIIRASDYEQSWQNAVYLALKKLKKAGYIEIEEVKFDVACTSSTCTHQSHDPETFRYAKVNKVG